MGETPHHLGFENAWQPLGQVPPGSLSEARLLAHWAVQPLTAAADALIAPETDDSHSSMQWSHVLPGQMGRELGCGYAAGLRISDLTLQVWDVGGEPIDERPLAGRTLEQALSWLSWTLQMAFGEANRPELKLRDYDMPDHPVGKGAAFPDTPPKAELEALVRWFANAERAISGLIGVVEEAGPVRVWPHHFDIASLMSFSAGRSIGLGMSPGDASYPQPYFYCNPWPYPQQRTGLPELAGGGHWHTEGWFGTVLPAEILAAAEPEAQPREYARFAESALHANRQLLEL